NTGIVRAAVPIHRRTGARRKEYCARARAAARARQLRLFRPCCISSAVNGLTLLFERDRLWLCLLPVGASSAALACWLALRCLPHAAARPVSLGRPAASPPVSPRRRRPPRPPRRP